MVWEGCGKFNGTAIRRAHQLRLDGLLESGTEKRMTSRLAVILRLFVGCFPKSPAFPWLTLRKLNERAIRRMQTRAPHEINERGRNKGLSVS